MTASRLVQNLKVVCLTVRHCRNWPAVILAKCGLNPGCRVVRLHNAFSLRSTTTVMEAWGEIYQPVIADVYELRRAGRIDLVVDVGANIGSFTLFARRLHPSAILYAFEPDAKTFACLQQNLLDNGVTNVHVIMAPVAGTVREVVFSVQAHGGASGFVLGGGARPCRMTTQTLAAVDWTGAERAFIKLDCEGAEGEVIRWICENAGRLPPRLAVSAEYHPWCPHPLEDLTAALAAQGFSVRAPMKYGEQYLVADRGH